MSTESLQLDTAKEHEMKHATVVCQTTQGIEIRAALVRLTRFMAVFDIHHPGLVLQASEVLTDFKIRAQDRTLYSGRAVVSSLIDTGTNIVCEVTLEDSWVDLNFFSPDGWRNQLREDFSKFISASQKTFSIRPEFKVVVADLQMFLMDLRAWLEQVELGVRSQPSGDRAQIEREAILAIQEPVTRRALQVLERFELTAATIEPDARAAHMNYMKRQIHPLVLCAPFIHRTFYKPLGYAGDYEMVNMMVRDPFEGASLFAKVINSIFLNTPPVQAHRDRLVYLKELLRDEIVRATHKKNVVRIFNLACGPAKEIQEFLATQTVARHAEFTLLDFNEETLAYTKRTLDEINRRREYPARIHFIRKSVNQLLKEALKFQNGVSKFDFVYCAGLFDYLSDPVCKNLLNLFYDLVAPGGLVVATNVIDPNPSRNWMEYVLDWNLVYRNGRQFASLKPTAAPADSARVRSVGDAVNIFLEVRKPEDV
jgi:extracellular factor (EF) 3-hydroxypalmitic acid methyl ester biosynthesis protein